MRLGNLINEEAHDVIRDYMGMGYSRAEAEAEARKRFPNEFDSPSPRRPQQKPSLQHMMFYNVPADREEEARNYGIKQTKSGKWAIGVYNTSGKQTQLKIEYADKAFGPGKKWTPKTNEGYKVMPPMDDKYQPRNGLEGPFTTLSGKVVYYDPKAGKYYDSDTDMYMSYDEFQALDKDYSDMQNEQISEGTWAIPNTAELVAKLEDAMSKPIPAKDASDMMYSLIGDDELFDSLGELEDDNPESDARPTIQRWLSANDELLASNIDDESVMSALRKMSGNATADSADTTKYGIVRYPDTAISYIKNDGNGWEHIYDKSYGFEGPVDKDDLQYASKIAKEKIPGRMLEACSGGRKKRKMSEAGGYYTQPVYDMIKKHGYEKVMHELLTSLDADVIQDFLQRAEFDESVTEAEGEVHTVYINGKKWKAFYKKETADKAAATITAKGKKAEVKTGPAPQYKGSNFSAPTKRETPKTSPAMAKALKSIETSFGPERKAIGDQVIAMARTAKMLADPKWADRAWKTVEQYGIKDKADLAKELKLLIADEQRAIDADTDGHLYGADSNIKTMQRALDLL